MSSTNRGSKRSPMDYYVTPHAPIELFLDEVAKDVPINWEDKPRILDPCAGGDSTNPMSYPTVIGPPVTTIDIREDSPAAYHHDYLSLETSHVHELCGGPPNIIITNPPFGLAMQVILKALKDVAPGGLIIMLLRLNYFGSAGRKQFFQSNMPVFSHVHSERIGFWPENISPQMRAWAEREEMNIPKKNAVDSIEYQHATWIQGQHPKFAQLRVI